MTSNLAHRVSRDIEFRVLTLLAEQGQPVGASLLQSTLLKEGVRVGEATIGRLLRQFDLRGATQKHGKLGRTVTALGQRQLQAMLRDRERRESGLEFMSALDSESPTMLLDVLVGRRAIERETTALAALRATETDVLALRRIQSEHDRSKVTGDSAVKENRQFHLAIARIGGNRVLATALELLLNEYALSEHVVHVREVAGAKFGIEHPRIIEAIGVRDPRRAAQTMADHINQIIRDVFLTYESVFEREGRRLSDYLGGY